MNRALSSRWQWLLSQVVRRIWFRASLFSLLGIATALLAIVASPYIPSDLPAKIGADAVDNILGIIASSMLAVTTFSLSTMVSAYSAATTNVTPRATTLIMEDSTTQNVLSTFIGSFLFSLVGLVALSTGAYGGRGRVILFAATILVIALIVITLLRWIDHLSRLGRVTETTERVEKAAIAAMRARRERPNLGGRPPDSTWHEQHPDASPVHVRTIGYIQHIDVGALQKLAEAASGEILVAALPGAFVGPAQPIAWISGKPEADIEAVSECFSIADVRSFDQDPRFGACVLAEIASRALSPAVNDPGTAIDVIGRAVRVLSVWSEEDKTPDKDVIFPAVCVPSLSLDDVFDDLFTPIARDGAAIVEVQLRLQKALRSLAQLGDRRFLENAQRHSRLALERAEQGLAIAQDRERVTAVARAIAGTSHG